MIKMIVTDLDGTLLRGDKSISDYTATILNRCKKNGIKVVFATARPERATRRFQEKIVPDYVIADNGATINHGDSVIRNLFIPSTMRDELLDLFLEAEAVKFITVEAGNCVFTNYDGPPWDTGWNIIYNDFSTGIDVDTPKLSVECENVDFLSGVMRIYPELHLYSNSGESWHQIMCKDATKTNAIRYISKTLGFTLDEVAAFGDDYNDVEMLKQCGVGVAVANAIDEAKASADYICDTNDNDGVGKWIGRSLIMEHNNNNIIPLEREKWQGYVLPFHYVSLNYYDVEIAREHDNFHVSFIKKPFASPFEYLPDKDYDKLFQSHWDDVKAWGIVENERLIAVVETAVEKWNNRLRVTELWIDDAYRRQGIGTALMDIVMKRAQDERRRAIMLETQSRNENALAFYMAYGFTLIGFNACEYQNNDLQRKEVRMEMGILLNYDD